MVDIGSAAGFAYEAVETAHSVSVSVDLFGYRPMVGITYITYYFSPVSFTAIQGYSSGRFGFIFGVVYKEMD